MIEAALVLAQANVENGVATRTREFLDWGALPDLWVIFLVVVPAVLLFAVMIYRRERPTGGRMKTGMAMIRALVILSVLLFLARPMYRSITYRTKDPLVLVLVDDSLSMQVVDVYSDRAVLPDRSLAAEARQRFPQSRRQPAKSNLGQTVAEDQALPDIQVDG